MEHSSLVHIHHVHVCSLQLSALQSELHAMQSLLAEEASALKQLAALKQVAYSRTSQLCMCLHLFAVFPFASCALLHCVGHRTWD